MMIKINYWILITLVVTCPAHAEMLIFNHGEHRLSGHYLKPKGNKPAKAVLLFVHGDGALSYDAEGYYDILWNPLRERGFAIFSWDKPGVGESSGNWLNQSMADRQAEVNAAIEAVQARYRLPRTKIGLIGFSQAGWVIPALSGSDAPFGFAVGVGFATNWVEQGRYYTQTRLRLAGADNNLISSAINAYTKQISYFDRSPSYSAYQEYAEGNVMKRERFQFVLKNYRSDASKDYLSIDVPMLMLWGDSDLNVDAQMEFEQWQTRYNNRYNNSALVSTRIISNATHGMLKADSFNVQEFGFKQWVKLMWMEEDALATGFLPTLIDWLEQQLKK